MQNSEKTAPSYDELLQHNALLEEKLSDLKKRIRQLSEENRQSESLVRVLLENTPFGILMFDNKHRVIQINKAAENLLGVQRVGIIGKSCEAIFNCYAFNNACPVLDENKTVDRVETDCDTKLCHCEQYLLRSVVKIDNAQETVLVEAFVDISPIKQAQIEIENANKTKDNFLAKVSHELRTPLNSIIGFTELLEDLFKPQDDGEESQYVKNIHRSGKTLLRMVDEILDITRITANKLVLDEYPVDIPGLLKQLSREFEDRCDEQNNTLQIICPDEISPLLTDPKRLHQVLDHLLDNACKFTRNGEIAINIDYAVVNDKDWIKFLIKDTGEGMSDEQLTRIFDEFEQVHVGHTRRHGGAGLGLTLCSRVSELMGGELTLRSKPEIGTEACLLLPVR
ncbi:MAG: PAS domain-containing sensor histidine kinase [Gammaproteobacteria bacterium]|nr:PAS domain-containing sensor histidine kinase [Gammaproteobacteria bacterium]